MNYCIVIESNNKLKYLKVSSQKTNGQFPLNFSYF